MFQFVVILEDESLQSWIAESKRSFERMDSYFSESIFPLILMIFPLPAALNQQYYKMMYPSV